MTVHVLRVFEDLPFATVEHAVMKFCAETNEITIPTSITSCRKSLPLVTPRHNNEYTYISIGTSSLAITRVVSLSASESTADSIAAGANLEANARSHFL